jgi:GPI mannosyltransferase 4
MTISGLVFVCLAIATDTAFYHGPGSTRSFSTLYEVLVTSPVITPWNNIRYNSQTSNLALHGLHPHYQHFLANLPQLLGPALILLVTSLQPFSLDRLRLACFNPRFLSAITGTAILSISPHQEPRFLLPCVPLLLTCIRLPALPRGRKYFWASWLIFNIILGTLMGIYHQGGVIPAQLQVPAQIKSLTASSSSSSTSSLTPPNTTITSATIFWWKTYPPPTYLLGTSLPATSTISTIPLLGLPQPEMLSKLSSALPSLCHSPSSSPHPHPRTSNSEAVPKNNNSNNNHTSHSIFLIAPLSSPIFPSFQNSFSITFPNPQPNPTHTNDTTTQATTETDTLSFTLTYTHRRHINLDDLDIGAEGVWATWRRVVGRRGIAMWRVRRVCGG